MKQAIKALATVGAIAAFAFATNATAQSAYANVEAPTSPQLHDQAIPADDMNVEVAFFGEDCPEWVACNAISEDLVIGDDAGVEIGSMPNINDDATDVSVPLHPTP